MSSSKRQLQALVQALVQMHAADLCFIAFAIFFTAFCSNFLFSSLLSNAAPSSVSTVMSMSLAKERNATQLGVQRSAVDYEKVLQRLTSSGCTLRANCGRLAVLSRKETLRPTDPDLLPDASPLATDPKGAATADSACSRGELYAVRRALSARLLEMVTPPARLL